MISFMAVIVAMVFMCHLTSAADLVSTGAVNGTSKGNLVNKPAVPIAPVVASTHQVNGKNLTFFLKRLTKHFNNNYFNFLKRRKLI